VTTNPGGASADNGDNRSTGAPPPPPAAPAPSTDNGQSMNAFGFAPMQTGGDGGIGPAPITGPDAGLLIPKQDGGITIGGPSADGGLH
jgi:hypothetical protein